jgi:TM2 domain-containing membrane protein YozV
MKNLFSKLLLLCLTVAFSLPTQQVVASVAATNATGNTTLLIEKMKSNNLTVQMPVVAKQHKGFFGKVKNFGNKMMIKAINFGAAGSEKNAGIAALIAFLIGTLGIHRVYMGSKPIIVLWYILTIGGVFGLLPLIDFIRLLLGHGDHYDGNNALFAAFK